MSLAIDTFSNAAGIGSAFFKAVGHPLCRPAAEAILARLQSAKRPAAYDPQNTLAPFIAVNGSDSVPKFAAVYAQNIAQIGKTIANHPARPITDIAADNPDILLLPVFDAKILLAHIAHLIPDGCEVITLDEMRLPEKFLADRRRYLNPLNFATNLLFFRERPGAHTRLTTANYWSAYGATSPFVWGRLFGENGDILADFEKPLGGANHRFSLDSQELKREFNLPDFCGQVFLHIARAAGHDIVKYVADSYGDESELSCTHDANSWPADLYAGIPAPDEGDSAVLWVQNSHPAAIPAGAIGANIMGDDGNVKTYDKPIPPFATRAVDLGEWLPEARWPQQIEIRAGRHFVRPRYEVLNGNGRRRINHANVERTDLEADANLPKLSEFLGKGYILPAPILPKQDFVCECLPTPMSTAQKNLPLTATVYNAAGEEIARRFLGCLPRRHDSLLNLSELAEKLPKGESGHVELTYDFAEGGEGDGWMHALFRYTQKSGGHMAETSFGAHMFNHILTYKGEPQSYKGPPPGLSTRLFLRLSPAPLTAFCHLIYPVCAKWNPQSETHLELKTREGEDVAQKTVHLAMGGSFAFAPADLFSSADLKAATEDGYLIIRDSTCRRKSFRLPRPKNQECLLPRPHVRLLTAFFFAPQLMRRGKNGELGKPRKSGVK